jgi:hypothetical protein
LANIKRANTSGVTKSGVAIADVPDRPTIGSATAVDGSSATVAYTAATTGGTGTTFTATSTPGSLTGTGSSPITVAGLTELTSYTFTVRASNSTGSSPFSAASNSITTPLATAYESIATVTVGSGGSSTVAFTSIPATYKHLQIRILNRSTRADAADAISLRFNSDSAANYSWHYLRGDGSLTGSGGSTSQNEINISYDFAASTAASSIFGVGIIDILDYANTNKNKTTRGFVGNDRSGAGAVGISSGNWRSTSATTSLTLTSYFGATFDQYSSFALYGVK